ncbi:hypothetical protein C8F04DRAFT_1253156 [Mycena alexandri]|uniref:Uncharacterized protein n=1 Tax=Mycena alexandri TaxID=1745969 RepID=A0AAD6WSN5_9AGAR|nr:hypothetical protein C8F04DRAFT_1271023 [Mycena alexandri]KAJ7041461.1 hypothetical protein C8F04DRAFT_1253156 [Mycena alexandri]
MSSDAPSNISPRRSQHLAPASPGIQPADAGDGTPEGGQQPPPQEVSAALHAVRSDCEVIISQFRLGHVAKGKALTEVYQKLQAAGESSAADHGRGNEPPSRQSAHAGRSLASPPATVHSSRDNDLKAQYPWTATDFIESSIHLLSPNLAETVRILKIYGKNLKKAKESLLILPLISPLDTPVSPHCPEFPDGEWANIVAGCAVSLNAVLSGLFSTNTNDERSQALGNGLELHFGTVAPTKSVTDAGTWTITFDCMLTATTFAFPHCARELLRYRDYIVSLFAAINSSFHNRVETGKMR